MARLNDKLNNNTIYNKEINNNADYNDEVNHNKNLLNLKIRLSQLQQKLLNNLSTRNNSSSEDVQKNNNKNHNKNDKKCYPIPSPMEWSADEKDQSELRVYTPMEAKYFAVSKEDDGGGVVGDDVGGVVEGDINDKVDGGVKVECGVVKDSGGSGGGSVREIKTEEKFKTNIIHNEPNGHVHKNEEIKTVKEIYNDEKDTKKTTEKGKEEEEKHQERSTPREPQHLQEFHPPEVCACVV